MEGQGWKWDSLQQRLPVTTMIHLAGMVISGSREDQDEMYWLMERKGDLSVKSAYRLAMDGVKRRVG